MFKSDSLRYRKDIDGLRALAVLGVIFYHIDLVPSGYLGVDVFFVISGFLITSILFKSLENDTLSLVHFYVRRIRRIIPLVLFITGVALIAGVVVMLPYDLDSLCQSIVATNLFSNNILEFMTTGDYWNIVNEYKPLMHTWSLGIEEQYYMLYPFLFLAVGIKRKNLILPLLLLISILSLFLYLSDFPNHYKFYLLPFRFFELSLGGCAAIIFKKTLWKHKFVFLLSGALILLLVMPEAVLHPSTHLLLTVTVTLTMLISSSEKDPFNRLLIENAWIVWVGKISFSLYMWHQLILAFTRYFLTETLSFIDILAILVLTFLCSVATYFIVEQPFRDRIRVSTKVLLWTVGLAFLLITGSALTIYMKGGVVRNVPELDIAKSNVYRNMHLDYNTRHLGHYSNFNDSLRTNILVVGNSFARDWINVLLESDYADQISISYYQNISDSPGFRTQLIQADRIFFTQMNKKTIDATILKYNLDSRNIYFLGPKTFGVNNGIYYNHPRNANYCFQRSSVSAGTLQLNSTRQIEWGDQYINLLAVVRDDKDMVPVFTPECKFISQDCLHFTKAGANFFARLMDAKLSAILFQ